MSNRKRLLKKAILGIKHEQNQGTWLFLSPCNTIFSTCIIFLHKKTQQQNRQTHIHSYRRHSLSPLSLIAFPNSTSFSNFHFSDIAKWIQILGSLHVSQLLHDVTFLDLVRIFSLLINFHCNHLKLIL